MKFQYGDIARFVSQQDHVEKNILVTGVTGFLGGHYLFWRSQLPGKIYVMVRATDLEQGRQRIYASLEVAAKSYSTPMPGKAELDEKIVCVLGDLMSPNCGISAAAVSMLERAEISDIWHCAANMAFLPKDRENLIHTNVSGTESLMGIGKLIGIRRFVYISTAYTAGAVKGEVPEALHADGQSFGNCYEESKHLAEHAVASFCDDNDINYTILRPSMVMGPMASMESGGTRFGVYGVAKAMHASRGVLRKVSKKLRLEIPDNTTLNMIAVDQVVFDMLYVESIDFGHQSVYHLTNRRHDTVRAGMCAIEKSVGLDAITYVDARDSATTSMEKMFDEGTRFSKGYYYSEKVFVRSLPDHHTVFDLEVLDKCLANFIKEIDGEQEKADFQKVSVESWDGLGLSAYVRGDAKKPTVMFINAYGMPLQFSVPLSRRLSSKYRFVTWDSRWVPDTTQEFEVEKCHSLTHAKDMIAIMDKLGIERCSVIGWSSGAQVCLRAMREFSDRIDCGLLLNTGVSLVPEEPLKETDYQQSLRSLFPKIGSSKRAAQLYCDLIYGDTTKVGANEQNRVGTMLNSLDPELMNMTSAPFKNPESLYRYANMLYRNFEEDGDAYTTGTTLPVLVYGSEEDEITHPDVARALAGALINSTLHIEPTGTHFAQYTDDSVAEVVMRFVEQHRDRPEATKQQTTAGTEHTEEPAEQREVVLDVSGAERGSNG